MIRVVRHGPLAMAPALCAMTYAIGPSSGALLNPAVTLGCAREVRRTVGRRSSQERFLMNRKSSLYPGVNWTGVGGPPLPGPTLRFQPQAFHRSPPVPGPTLRFQPQAFLKPTPLGSLEPTPLGVPPTRVPFTPGYSELLRFIKNRFLKERHPTVRRTTAGRTVAAHSRTRGTARARLSLAPSFLTPPRWSRRRFSLAAHKGIGGRS